VPTLAAPLTQLFSDDAERERMGKESLEIIGTHGVNTTLATFEDVYKEAITESRRLTRITDHPRPAESAGTPRERAERSA
jgi:ketosteroid isomerase-like protein